MTIYLPLMNNPCDCSMKIHQESFPILPLEDLYGYTSEPPTDNYPYLQEQLYNVLKTIDQHSSELPWLRSYTSNLFGQGWEHRRDKVEGCNH